MLILDKYRLYLPHDVSVDAVKASICLDSSWFRLMALCAFSVLPQLLLKIVTVSVIKNDVSQEKVETLLQ